MVDNTSPEGRAHQVIIELESQEFWGLDLSVVIGWVREDIRALSWTWFLNEIVSERKAIFELEECQLCSLCVSFVGPGFMDLCASDDFDTPIL